MTHAEQYSTSVPRVPSAPRRSPRNRVFAVLTLAFIIAIASAVFTASRPASAGSISDDKAQAAAIAAKIQATQAQIATLSGQVQAADYQLTQLNSQIAANQAQVVKDQAEVTKDQGQLRTQAISDYTNSGSSNNQVTQMFSSNMNTSAARSVYASIATGNVTTTIDNLHTAQNQLQAAQSALQQQQAQATTTRNTLQSSETQASALAAQDQAALNSVNADIQNQIKAQQAAEQAAAQLAATTAFNAKVAAAQKAQAAAQTGGVGRGAGSSSGSGVSSVPTAPPPPVPAGVGGAIQAAESQIGTPYVWGGSSPGGFDCSGLVMWSFGQAGIGLPRTSGAQYAATTHIPLADIQPGDLLFYGPGGSEHVAIYIGGGTMVEAPYTGATVWNTGVRTGEGFVGVGRVG
jgi:cell wall-associated NlpC family hydrolase